MSEYKIKVSLPSKGIFYPNNPELAGEIELRMMNTSDEKKIYGSSTDDVVSSLIRSCVTNMKLDPDMLVAADREFLLVKLRIHTYGDDYHMNGVCPSCGFEHEFKYSIDDVAINELPAEFEEPIKVLLPYKNIEVGLKVLRTSDKKKIRSRAKRMAKDLNIPPKEIEFIQRMVQMILTIDGAEVKPTEAEKFVNELSARDAAVMRNAVDKLKLGYDSVVSVDCPSCKEEFLVPFVLTAEFFRPRFD